MPDYTKIVSDDTPIVQVIVPADAYAWLRLHAEPVARGGIAMELVLADDHLLLLNPAYNAYILEVRPLLEAPAVGELPALIEDVDLYAMIGEVLKDDGLTARVYALLLSLGMGSQPVVGPEYSEGELICPDCGQKNVTLTATVPPMAKCWTTGCGNSGDPYNFLDEPDERPADEPSDVDQNDPTDGSVDGPDD